MSHCDAAVYKHAFQTESQLTSEFYKYPTIEQCQIIVYFYFDKFVYNMLFKFFDGLQDLSRTFVQNVYSTKN